MSEAELGTQEDRDEMMVAYNRILELTEGKGYEEYLRDGVDHMDTMMSLGFDLYKRYGDCEIMSVAMSIWVSVDHLGETPDSYHPRWLYDGAFTAGLGFGLAMQEKWGKEDAEHTQCYWLREEADLWSGARGLA